MISLVESSKDASCAVPRAKPGSEKILWAIYIVASLAGWSAELPAGLSEASKDRPRTRKLLLKVKCLLLL